MIRIGTAIHLVAPWLRWLRVLRWWRQLYWVISG